MENLSQKLYEDFTTQILPKVQEGMVITKDYAMDLAGRYIKYLIIIDSFAILILPILLFCTYYSYGKIKTWDYPTIASIIFIVSTICLFVSIPITIFDLIPNLVKTIYIPEVRIYQELDLTK